MSVASEYAELLKLIEVSGPFLSLPIYREVFPQGLLKDAPDLTRQLRELYVEWCAARLLAPHVVSPAQREWLRAVFLTLLEWPVEWLVEDNAIPQNLSYLVAQHHETLRPDLVLLEDGKPRLLISVLPPSEQPDRRPASTTWNVTSAARMAELLRATRVPLGLVTNGERFTLVYAEPDQPTGFADFRAELWFDERLTLRAFRDFLSAGALFNRPPEQVLDALYRRSLENQQEVSTTLGRQVRRAVELFVAALDRADRESGRVLLAGVAEEHVYEAALSLMMRLVFLFFAEERDLLPVTNPVYRENYAVSSLHDQLREAADRLGEEVLERRYDAFPRLLATFRAVHGGIGHDLAALPAYGGDLFNPDRFPFLEGRPAGSDWRETPAQPCPIHNRTVLHLLTALQFLEMKVPGGGRESRRLSFRVLDIEQIGHVYEGLLDHTARRAMEIVLGLDGKDEPDIALSELNRRREQPGFVEWLADETGRSCKAIEKALQQTAIDDPLRWPEWEQVSPFAGLVRRDDNSDPWVIPAGSLYVTAGTARRQTGTQYTPRTLTESVVEHALAPLVYTGPAEGLPTEDWCLKPADQILELKICDFACGSAAFLVAAARYLSACLAEAWGVAQLEHGANVQITPYGHPSSGMPEEELIPSNSDERGLYALRVVVERCLYGVDRNPLAVEMAKLSLWLLTLQRNKPFTFLDHAIRCGDSLLGVDLKQLSTWSLSGTGTQTMLFEDDLSFAADKREGLMKMQYHPGDQRRLLDAALAKTRRLRAAADRLIATAFEANPEASAAAVSMGLEEQETEAQKILEGKRPFHWPVEFPEVFLHGGGFDAIVGNPPYMGGPKLTGAFGKEYRDYLVSHIADGKRGTADLAAYFCLRTARIARPSGFCGLIVTSSVVEGDSREVGLQQVLTRGATVIRAVRSRAWPGAAKVTYTAIWLYFGSWNGVKKIDDHEVPEISAMLTATGASQEPPVPLICNRQISFNGVKVYGEGFVISSEEKDKLISDDAKNADVLFPYLTAEELNSRPNCDSTTWAIRFFDWPLRRELAPAEYRGRVAADYPHCLRIVEERVKPERTRLDENGNFVLDLSAAQKWWIYARPRPALYASIAILDHALAIATQATKYVAFALVPARTVFSHSLAIIASDSFGLFATLSSSLHDAWARHYGSYNLALLRYSPSDLFDTFPMPLDLLSLQEDGRKYYNVRRDIMSERKEGLTATYNRLHDPHEVSHDIAKFRALHVGMDHAIAAGYGWTDLDLGHGFLETKQGVRFTISEAARREVLDRLLALNHERYAEEQAAALAVPRPKAKSRKRVPEQQGLF